MKKNELDNTTGKNHTGKRANLPVKILTASSIIGDKIFNKNGDRLGRIRDIMLNLQEGKIQYVIISSGGFMGLSQKYFAVPFESLILDTEQQAFIYDQSKKEFENHPGFNKEHWPEANYHTQFSNNYGGFMGPNTGSDH